MNDIEQERMNHAAEIVRRTHALFRRAQARTRKAEAENTKLHEWQASVRKAFETAAHEHPYKIPGNPDTYSQYNEGWQDALMRVDALGGITGAGDDEDGR